MGFFDRFRKKKSDFAAFLDMNARQAGYSGYGRNQETRDYLALLRAYGGKGAKKIKDWGKGGFRIHPAIRVLAILAIIFQAFSPFVIFQASLSIGIGLVAIFVAIVLVVAFMPEVTLGAGKIAPIISVLLLIFLIFLFSQYFNCGKSTCYELLSRRLGTTITAVILLVLIVVGLVLCVFDGGAFIFMTIIFGGLIFFLIPYLSDPQVYFQACSQIPYLVGSFACKSREVWIDPLQTVKIPVGGGLGLSFGSAETGYQPVSLLYAGEPYEFDFIVTSYYEQPITFKISPAMLSSYGSGIEFVQPYDQRKDTLNPKEFYPDIIRMDPEQITVKDTSTCPYTGLQINRTQGITIQEVTCASDKPCGDPKYACVKIGNFECDCVDWAKATCSKDTLKAKMNIKHSGFFRGIAKLYYSPTQTSPQPATELTQGPLSVIIEFQPNPYIATIHQYRQDVSIYVRFKNMGGDITIKSFKILPQNTVIHTVDNGKEMELIEEVGTQTINCNDINGILSDGFLPSGQEAGGKLCTITPPFIKTTLKDRRDNKVVEETGVTLDDRYAYCNNAQSVEETSAGSTFWGIDWSGIYNGVKESGMCEILRGSSTEEKRTVENSLTYTQVVVEIQYERSATFLSHDITPYTRTEECLNLVPTESNV